MGNDNLKEMVKGAIKSDEWHRSMQALKTWCASAGVILHEAGGQLQRMLTADLRALAALQSAQEQTND